MWTCPKCKSRWTNGKLRCTCGRKAPKRRATHTDVLKEHPYEWFVEQFGEHCGICGVTPAEGQVRLNRDTDHKDGYRPRGLLCWRCNKYLHDWMSATWLLAAAAYVAGVSAETWKAEQLQRYLTVWAEDRR